jgi:hypothetical protein
VVEKSLHLLEKLKGGRQFCVLVEGSFVCPMGVQVKQPRVADGAKAVNLQAPRLLTGGKDDLSHCLAESIFASFASVEFTKDKQLHCATPLRGQRSQMRDLRPG